MRTSLSLPSFSTNCRHAFHLIFSILFFFFFSLEVLLVFILVEVFYYMTAMAILKMFTEPWEKDLGCQNKTHLFWMRKALSLFNAEIFLWDQNYLYILCNHLTFQKVLNSFQGLEKVILYNNQTMVINYSTIWWCLWMLFQCCFFLVFFLILCQRARKKAWMIT